MEKLLVVLEFVVLEFIFSLANFILAVDLFSTNFAHTLLFHSR